MQFTTARWRFGGILALYTVQGLRSVILGKRHSTALIQTLNRTFPNAKKAPEQDRLHEVMQGLIHYANTLRGSYEGPLDIQNTPFQKEVWYVLSTIPLGNTMTYAEIAKQVGRPNAYRAVANACGANPLPLIIPCHRAIGTNSLGGYRFGTQLKHRLLAWEKH